MISEFCLKLLLMSICIGNAIAMVNSLSTDSSANGASNASFNSTSQNGTSTARQGWTSSPNGRGTIDIIWQCSSTIFLCCWTALCLNVPSSHWGKWRWYIQKTCMGCLGIIGPEFHFQLALGQWTSACRSVMEFKRSGYPQWSMKHAFLADMGGFALRPQDWVEFVLDAKQVHYLVAKGYIEYAAVELDHTIIEDKNKSDSIGRFITVCQILWFTLNCFGRVIQHLAITTFELTTLGFIVCTLGTCFVWRHKPMDVITPIILVPNTTIADILVKAGQTAHYKFTPLDFVSSNDSSWQLYWTYWMDLVRKMGIDFVPKQRPTTHIADDNFPALSPRTMFVLFLFQSTYAGIHIGGWNFDFPSRIEHVLWRVSTIYILGSIVFYWLFDLYAWHLHVRVKHYFTSGSAPAKTRDSEENDVANCCNDSGRHDPALEVPLKALIPITVLAAVYLLARAYVLIEDFVSLRSQPPSAYDSIDWPSFLPHLL